MNTASRSLPTWLGRAAFTDTGEGSPPLLLLHGLPTAKELFSPLVALLAPRFRCIAVDLPDFGESERQSRQLTHVERAAWLDEVRAGLGLERFCLVAHDLGDSVAVDYMAAYGEHVERLVLMSPPVYPDFRMPFIVRLVRTPGLGAVLLWLGKDLLATGAIRRGMNHAERYTPQLRRAIQGAFDGAEGRAALLRDLRWGRPDITFARYPEHLRGIRVPTLVLQGGKDPYIPREHAERLVGDVAGARLVVIEEGSHFLPMDVPQRVADELQRFLAS